MTMTNHLELGIDTPQDHQDLDKIMTMLPLRVAREQSKADPNAIGMLDKSNKMTKNENCFLP